MFGFDDSDQIVVVCSGNDNSEFLEKIADDQRQFVFVRVTTGDELSKRAKFAFISWIGENVAALKRAKMTQARSLIKEVIKVIENLMCTLLYSFLMAIKHYKINNLYILIFYFTLLITILKNYKQSYAVEISPSERDEITEENILQEVKRAGGANYGTGM